MTVFLALLLQAAPAAAAPPKDVVVTGQRLETTANALAECLARHCPPKEDIDASLAHGENLFLAGEYAQARHVLGKARARNLRYAATYPVEVGDLARAYGCLSTSTGSLTSDESRRSTRSMRSRPGSNAAMRAS